MKLLDRYFFRQLLICLIFCLLTFVFFYVMIDLFGRLDEIIESKIPLETIANYYLSLIPLIFVRMCPLAILLATMYVLNNLSRNNEIIAAVSGGIHPNRILVPFLIAIILWCLSLNKLDILFLIYSIFRVYDKFPFLCILESLSLSGRTIFATKTLKH